MLGTNLEVCVILSLLLALAPAAHALDTRWWGIGPTVGTMAIPGRYPTAFPANAKDAAGDPLVQKVRGDISFGAHAVLYPDKLNRLGLRGLIGVGIGQPWTSGQLTLEYDRAIVHSDGFQLLFGAGLGAGTERFAGVDSVPDGFLVTNYFPVRAELAALLRDKTRAYEVSLYGTWHIVADQTYHAIQGDDGITGADAAVVPGAFYAGVGIEATVYFGDFRKKKTASDEE
jgi:hypothetical protein